MDSHHFVAQPARYRTSYWKSIFILNPGIALTISPTVNLYGSEFGTDKIAHVFQQGYTYYKALSASVGGRRDAGGSNGEGRALGTEIRAHLLWNPGRRRLFKRRSGRELRRVRSSIRGWRNPP